MVKQVIFVSATPADYELKKSGGVIVEQVIRPTGLVDPLVEIRPVKNQIDDLIGETVAVLQRHPQIAQYYRRRFRHVLRRWRYVARTSSSATRRRDFSARATSAAAMVTERSSRCAGQSMIPAPEENST